MQICLIQFVLLDLLPIKYSPNRPMPSGEKLHFCLAVFHKNNILRRLSDLNFLNVSFLNQNLMVKRGEFKWKLCYFDVLA